MKAEELLKVLEQGTSTKSEMLSQLKEINKHLESLSSSAPSLTVEQQSRLTAQLSKRSESRQEKKPTHLPGQPFLCVALPFSFFFCHSILHHCCKHVLYYSRSPGPPLLHCILVILWHHSISDETSCLTMSSVGLATLCFISE